LPTPSESDAPTRHDFGEHARRDVARTYFDLEFSAYPWFQNMADAEPLGHESRIDQKFEHGFRICFDNDSTPGFDRRFAHCLPFFRF